MSTQTPTAFRVIEDTVCITADDPMMFSGNISCQSSMGYEPVGSPTIFAKPHRDDSGWTHRFTLVMAKYRIEYH